MAITSVTAGPPRLTEPAASPPGEVCRYGVGWPFQVASRRAALLCCLRNEGYPVGDFENGHDVLLFDRLDGLDPAGAIPIARNDKYVNPRGERRIVIHYGVVGGFVPLGALRGDGAPHPHAGTGFGVSDSLDFPMLGKGHYTKTHKKTKVIMRTHVYQFSYNGNRFLIDDTEVYPPDEPLRASGAGSEWPLRQPALKQGIPDGDDILYPINASRGDLPRGVHHGSCGVSRWQRRGSAWEPVSYVPVMHNTEIEMWGEPSLVGDVDGALLFAARGCYGDKSHVVRVWRSADRGVSWGLVIDEPEARGESPITINQAVDGTPYLVTSKFGHERDWLVIHPLNEERDGLLPAIDVRNALADFGPPPKGPIWFMDHAMGQTLRLGDGRWHHVLSYRNMDRGEHAGGAPPPSSGQYLEEVFSDGPERPAWRFQ